MLVNRKLMFLPGKIQTEAKKGKKMAGKRMEWMHRMNSNECSHSNCFRNMSAGVQRSFCTLNEKFYLFLLSYSKRCIYMLIYNWVFVSFLARRSASFLFGSKFYVSLFWAVERRCGFLYKQDLSFQPICFLFCTFFPSLFHFSPHSFARSLVCSLALYIWLRRRTDVSFKSSTIRSL